MLTTALFSSMLLAFVPGLQDPTPSTQFAPLTKGMTLPGVETSEFHSRFTGHDYHVWVCLPPGYGSGEQRYPVLYVPDVEFVFLAAKAAKDGLDLGRVAQMGSVIEEFILVGVPLKTATNKDWLVQRITDLTPTASAKDSTNLGRWLETEVRSGGAPLFLRAMQEELIPFIESNYRVTADRGVAGYSLGGLFAAWLWLQDDRTFSRYLIGSPSLWWDDEILLQVEAEAAASGKQLRGRVFASVGADEPKASMVEPLQRLTATVAGRNHPELQLVHTVFADEVHLSAVPATFSRGILTLYREPELQKK